MTICKKICTVDKNNEFCIGCGRTLGEITEWYYADKARKKEISKSAKNRLSTEMPPDKNETLYTNSENYNND